MLGHSLQQIYIFFVISISFFASTSFAMETKESPMVNATIRAIQFGYINELEDELRKGGNPDETTSTGIPLLCMLGHWVNMGEPAIIQVSKCLLDAKANINAQSLKSKNSALHIAIEYSCFLHARELIERGASLTLPNKDGDTPHMLLAKCTQKNAQELIPHKICYSNNK